MEVLSNFAWQVSSPADLVVLKCCTKSVLGESCLWWQIAYLQRFVVVVVVVMTDVLAYSGVFTYWSTKNRK